MMPKAGRRAAEPFRRGSANARSTPSTQRDRILTYYEGETFPVECQAHGTSVDGDDVWYALPPSVDASVSARSVTLIGRTPVWCDGAMPAAHGVARTHTVARSAPTRADRAASVYRAGAAVAFECWTTGQQVAGSDRWY